MRDRISNIGLIAGPLVFLLVWALPQAEGLSPAGQRTAGVALWMAVWWITEAVPIYVTGLVPLVAFPMLHILKAGEMASAYGHYLIYLFMGGFMLARAIERWNLHERIALQIVSKVGTSPRRLILGMMVATAFLSMWISNTATALIMLPIGLAILNEAALIGGTRVEDDPDLLRTATAMMLGVAYAANIGGMGTLVGTAPNVVFVGQLGQIFPDAPEISFLDWMQVALPLVLVFIPLTFFYLTRVAFPIHRSELPGGRTVIATKLAELPPLKGPELRVAWVFLAAALLWIFRKTIDLGFASIPGWADLLSVGAWVNDATVAVLAALALFVIPSGTPTQGENTGNRRLLDWETASTIPWGLLVLFGGGLALAAGVGKTGLSEWIGGAFSGLSTLPLVFTVLMICLLVTFLTEITSNTAITTLFMPVLAAVAVSVGENPILFMLPAALSASCAFMMPVATPPNAIVFGSGYVRIRQMAMAGLSLNLIGAVLITLVIYLLAMPVFGIDGGVIPDWTAGR
ncbi:MAG: SLC13 family permease [Nitrospirota bacterium]|nr:SLC13 family permease [Nitrospirota bacterium]